MSRNISIKKIDAARAKLAKARTLVVPPLEKVNTNDNPVVITFKGGMVQLFRRELHGALLGRVKLELGEYIRMYNPITLRWENYPLKDFQTRFFDLSAGVGMGDYAIVDGVYHSSSGTDYCREWSKDQVAIVLRMFKPE